MSETPEPLSEENQPKPPVLKTRVTIVENIYHQIPGEKPLQVESRFTRELEYDEQPYVRRCTVGEDPQPLDCGWIDNPGMIHIQNHEGAFLQKKPTAEEQEEASKKIIAILYADSQGSLEYIQGIPPGESERLNPGVLREKWLHLQCLHGKAKYTITVFPR